MSQECNHWIGFESPCDSFYEERILASEIEKRTKPIFDFERFSFCPDCGAPVSALCDELLKKHEAPIKVV